MVVVVTLRRIIQWWGMVGNLPEGRSYFNSSRYCREGDQRHGTRYCWRGMWGFSGVIFKEHVYRLMGMKKLRKHGVSEGENVTANSVHLL